MSCAGVIWKHKNFVKTPTLTYHKLKSTESVVGFSKMQFGRCKMQFARCNSEDRVLQDAVRGGVTKKNGKIWKKFPRGGGETDENSQFQFGNLKNLGRGGGGSQFFKKV